MDKLTEVTTPSTTVDYSYDATGRRISRTEATSTSNYHHNAKSDLTDYETDGEGSLTTAYNRGPDGLISETDLSGTPSTTYNLYNPHGDTSALTDETGAVTGSYRYDSFGNPISGNPPINGYTGKWQREKDDSTGTVRMGVREYDPALGRFVSADPLKGDPTNPQQRNRYPYVGNDPASRYDLDGNTWYEPWTWGDDESNNDEDEAYRNAFDESGNRTVLPPYNENENYMAEECGGPTLSHQLKCQGKVWKRQGLKMVDISLYLSYSPGGQRGPIGLAAGVELLILGSGEEYVGSPVCSYFGW